MARETSGGAGARDASQARAPAMRGRPRHLAWAHAPALAVAAAPATVSLHAAVAPVPAGDAPRFRRLGLENGLSHSSVYTILQDRQGFLWFGTQAGLDRYD